MTARNVPLPQGNIGWLFPALTDDGEQIAVLRILQTADDAVYQVGQRLEAQQSAYGVPLNRFYYQRLGPEPEFPVTILRAEGWSDLISVEVLLAPTSRSPYTRPGPPWEVVATIFVRCDSDPDNCRWHEVDARTMQPIATPMAAATEVQEASEWLLQRMEEETEQSLRAHDPKRGHPAAPRRID